GVFGDSQFTSTLSVNFHFPKIPRRTIFYSLTPDGRYLRSAGLYSAGQNKQTRVEFMPMRDDVDDRL
ncbi:hypothetical protein, partial [Aeromonas caviae]|uniref:hypothetical protein n=1 Tax=Aeromonas caviae TaxID=648 RepID=UPI002B475427